MWKKMASFLFFIANAYLCTQLHIYSWTRTGMHVIKQVSSDFIWQEESIVIMILFLLLLQMYLFFISSEIKLVTVY